VEVISRKVLAAEGKVEAVEKAVVEGPKEEVEVDCAQHIIPQKSGITSAKINDSECWKHNRLVWMGVA
jgi:hypothetical protein